MTELTWKQIKQQVYERANACCEYCRTSENNTGQTMQVDHIDPQGGDISENLCLACWNCNNHKRQATLIIDPDTEAQVRLYNPRNDVWADHFEWTDNSTYIHGLTPIGRATIVRLKMNRPALVIARHRWVQGGYHPPE